MQQYHWSECVTLKKNMPILSQNTSQHFIGSTEPTVQGAKKLSLVYWLEENVFVKCNNCY